MPKQLWQMEKRRTQNHFPDNSVREFLKNYKKRGRKYVTAVFGGSAAGRFWPFTLLRDCGRSCLEITGFLT
jgi:hypothetical protein